MNPISRRARFLRAAGIVATVVGVILAIPFIVAKLFIDANGERR